MPTLSPSTLAEKWLKLQQRFMPAYVPEADPLTQWREKVLLHVVLLATFLGPFALGPSLALALAEKLWAVMVIDCLAYGVVFLLLLVYKRWSLPLRAWIACLLLFFLGLGLLFLLGPYGAGYIWLFSGSVMAGGLIGLAAGAWSLLLNLAAMLAVALAIQQGLTSWPHSAANSLSQWLVMTSNFMLLNTLVTITTSLMLSGLKRSLQGEQQVSANLRESEARFRGLADNAPDVIFTLDPKGRFTYANPAVFGALGRRPEDILGVELADLAAPGQRQEVQNNLTAIMEAETSQSILEATLLHADGRHLEFLLSGAPNQGPRRDILGMVGLLKDVTEQRLLARQLQHAQKMEAVGTLAGGMAHDFNNLLGAMMGYAELALDTINQDGAPREELTQILVAADQASDLVKRILTFSRKVEPNLKAVDLNQEIHQAARMLSRTIPKMIEITVRPAENLPLVAADPGQISQVLMNLGTNARDAMPNGGVLTMSTATVELDEDFCRTNPNCRPGPHVRLSVSDTGEGMDQATLEHVFEPFFTKKGPGRGTGLGLAMVFGIVKGHGGCIVCISRPGQGASFEILLPLIAPGAGPPPQTDAEDPAGKLAQGTVLVVDDEPAMREVAQRALASAGVQTLAAGSGEEALELYRRRGREIDMVLLDLNMPGMGGVACFGGLLQMDPAVKVIIASGYGNPAGGGLPAAPTAFLPKPFRQKQLLEVVSRTLSPK